MWFFFNQKTSQTQWDQPLDFRKSTFSAGGGEEDDDDDGYEYVAVITGENSCACDISAHILFGHTGKGYVLDACVFNRIMFM
jgi:hypothetical protein